MAIKITIKHAQWLARHLGMSIRKTSAGDFRVNKKGAPESHAVYEANIGDALATAVYIFKHKKYTRTYMRTGAHY